MRKLKPFVVALCTVVLVAAGVLGTVAYLTDTTSVVNTFTVGNVNIRLDETKVDVNGEPVGDMNSDGEDDRTESGNEYHLVPGMRYVKDPTMTVLKGSEESYVRIVVTISCYSELTAIFGDPFLPQYFVEGWDSAVWVSTEVIDTDTENNTATYEFRYYKTVEPAANSDLVLEALFTDMKVSDDLTGEQLATIADLEITIHGHAIQAAGFADADSAWAAFEE